MKISIITINLNNRDGLQKTIDSVVCQTWQDFEWIVIDGGSTDGSKELIEQYQQLFAYWCSEPDKGVYNAMNKGIAHAKGEYLIFMNSGDTFYNNLTLNQVFNHTHTEDILYGNWMQIYNDHLKHVSYPVEANIWNLYCRTINQQAMFVKRTILQEKGFDESFRLRGDGHRWIVAALDGCSFKHIGLTISCYYMDGISQKGLAYPEEENAIKKLIPSAFLPAMHKMYVYENAHYYVRLTKLMKRGGIAAYITNAFLKMMSLLFK